MADFDAVLIPGGGLTPSGELTPFVRARLDRAATHSARFYIPLSAATPHFPPPLDARGYPIFEALPSARHLHRLGIPQQRILAGASSYDTVGDAFFGRIVHAEPRGLRRLLIVNSEFHMPRTEAVFRWVFGAAPDRGFELSFESTENIGISPAALAARREKERAGLDVVRELAARIATLSDLHQWIFTGHGAYAWFMHDAIYRPIGGLVAESYGSSNPEPPAK